MSSESRKKKFLCNFQNDTVFGGVTSFRHRRDVADFPARWCYRICFPVKWQESRSSTANWRCRFSRTLQLLRCQGCHLELVTRSPTGRLLAGGAVTTVQLAGLALLLLLRLLRRIAACSRSGTLEHFPPPHPGESGCQPWQGRARHDRARQDRAGQGRAGHCTARRPQLPARNSETTVRQQMRARPRRPRPSSGSRRRRHGARHNS